MHIAIVGCGQLARMLALAGIPMGLKFSFVKDKPDSDTSPINGLGNIVPWSPDTPVAQLYEALGRPDVVTIEKEQLDAGLLKALQPFCSVFPNADAVAQCQHRHTQKQLLSRLDIAAAPFVYGQSLRVSVDRLGLPVVVKSCREGYDGKNQWTLKSEADVAQLEQHFAQLGDEQDYIVEQWIPFERELSLVSARSAEGEVTHYCLTENHHVNGMLRESIAPAPKLDANLQAQAQQSMQRLFDELDYVGVLAMECFVVDSTLLVNELAPRVHNSGHWTQQGSATCQFENHLRAITGTVLGNTASIGVTGMINLVGTAKPSLKSLDYGVSLHWYDKAVKPGRKLGHLLYNHPDLANVQEYLRQYAQTKSP